MLCGNSNHAANLMRHTASSRQRLLLIVFLVGRVGISMDFDLFAICCRCYCCCCRWCCSCSCLTALPPPQSNPAETREFLICSRQWEGQCKCQQGAPVGGGLERGVGSGEGGGGMTKACRPLCQLASFSLSGSASEVICPFSPNSPLKFT